MATIARNASDAGLRDWLQAHVGLRIAEMAGRSEEGATTMARVQLLGAPQLHARDGSMRALERREAALLALLAIEGPLPRARAAALLWADADSEHARSSLRQRLFKLRRSAGIDVVAPGDVLRIAEGVEHDLMPIAQRLAEDPAAASAELLGELDYSDCPGLADWVAAAREQWRSRRVQALAEIAARLEAEQKVSAALPYAERLVADDPTLEHGHRRLMRLHYLRGDRAAALAAYDRCHELLRLELGTAPGAETQALRKLVEASGALPQRVGGQLPISILRPPRLIGREAQWAVLDAARAEGKAALVLGEPGIGKSRLIGDWADANGAVRARARPGDDRVAYALLSAMLRDLAERHPLPAATPLRAELARLLPELGAGAVGTFDPATVRAAVVAWLSAAAQDGLAAVVIDDLQFADEASLEELPRCVARTCKLAWVFAARGGELPKPVREWRWAGDFDGLIDVQVGPLDQSAVRQLLASLAIDGLDPDALAPALTRHTGGNPLFVLETLREQLQAGALRADKLPAPATVGQLMLRRLGQLTPEALKLARVAAVAGQDFEAALAMDVLKKDALDLADGWRELEAAHVIADGAFAHDLVHAAVLASVPQPIQGVLHHQVAAYLQARKGVASRIAAHWEAAGQWQLAAQQYLAAAEAAAGKSQRADELGLLQCAMRNLERQGSACERFDCQARLAGVHLLLGSHQAAQRQLESMRAAASSNAELLRVAMAEVDLFASQRKTDEALAAARQARLLAGSESSPEIEGAITRLEATALARAGRGSEALALMHPWPGRLAQAPQTEAAARFWSDYGEILIESLHGQAAIEPLEKALAIAVQHANHSLSYHTLLLLGTAQFLIGDLVASTVMFEQARQLYRRLDPDLAPARMQDMYLARNLRVLGRFGEALQIIGETVELQQRLGNPYVLLSARSEMAMQFVWLGQIARARQTLGALPDGLPSIAANPHRVATARIEQAEGKPVRHHFEAAVAASARDGNGPYYRFVLTIEICRELPAEEAVANAQALLEESRALDIPASTWPLKVAVCDALRRAGRHREAAAIAHEICAAHRQRAPAGMYAPEYWWVAHQALLAHGEEAAADAALRQAVEWIRRCAANHVPAEFRDSFLHRNPFNPAILAAAARRAAGP